MRISMVVSRFNEAITHSLKTGALERLAECRVPEHMITVIDVPGAIEIPLIAKQLAKQKKYDAIICLGAVIRGETSHYDYVCEQVSQGCQQVMLEFDIPVIFGVLTTETIAQALDRVGGSHGHKGRDAVDTALEMVRIMENLSM